MKWLKSRAVFAAVVVILLLAGLVDLGLRGRSGSGPATPDASPTPAPTRAATKHVEKQVEEEAGESTPPAPTPSPTPAETREAADTGGAAVEEEPAQDEEPGWSGIGGRTGVITYVVQDGDTIWSIAHNFGLDIDTLRWSNEELEHNPDVLSVGQELVILPVSGAYHTVQPGETLAAIAAAYGVSGEDIAGFPPNGIDDPSSLRAGQKLVIPGGGKRVALPHPAESPDYLFAWPLVGYITQNYSADHPAIDIGAPYGSKVYAAADGRVISPMWSEVGYGYNVIIDHGDGYETLYAHMKGKWVNDGDYVERGQLIGEVGSTGHSTGPHVHFEVRIDGAQVNPLLYLPPGDPQ